jgi:hypothetical protein
MNYAAFAGFLFVALAVAFAIITAVGIIVIYRDRTP